MEKKNLNGRRPHIALLASPGMGHLYPLAELAKCLVHRHGFSASVITFSNFSSMAQTDLLMSLHPDISSISLPFISLDDLPIDALISTRIITLLSRSEPHIHGILVSLQKTTQLAAFVADLFSSNLLLVAKDLAIPHYIFYSASCTLLALALHFPIVYERSASENQYIPDPLLLPGCLPLNADEFPEELLDNDGKAYPQILHILKGYMSAEGILVNSFDEFEPGPSIALRNEREKHFPPVYLVGPFVRSGSDEIDESKCLDWLDQQPSNLVLFVSFGSGGALTRKQMIEIAFGLEASEQRFLWVVRCPCDEDKSAHFFSQGQNKIGDPLNYLPEGFAERNKERGMVVPSWAPQAKVLAHNSVGGFLTHCGWNSVLESVCNGVPMITWPLYAEQKMNRKILVEGAGIAIKPVAREDGVVERGEFARVVRELMQGEGGRNARKRVEELCEAATRAMSENGSSHLALTKVAEQWKDAHSMI